MFNNPGGDSLQTRAPATPLIEVTPILRNVYLWMVLGLLTTAGVAWVFAQSGLIFSFFSNPLMPIVTMVSTLGIVFYISARIMKMNPTTALILFFVYAAILGVMLSGVLLAFTDSAEMAVYSQSAVVNAFLTTAGLFGAMTVVGFTTKMDLTKYSTFLFMALIGLVIAMVVNWLLQSAMLDFVISVIGVLLFTALTAYDTQKIKNWAADPEIAYNADMAKRLAVLGALTLYLDFINLFLFLLRLFGGGRD